MHLVAACIGEGDFTPPENYTFLQMLGRRLHIWHAEDDRVVPIRIGEFLSETLSQAQAHFFSWEKDYGHFHGIPEFPELEKTMLE